MPYVTSKISRKVRLLCWKHELYFMDLYAEHLTPATFFRHCDLKSAGILGSEDHVISRPQVLHCTLLRGRPTLFGNCKAKRRSHNRYVRKSLFRPPSSRNIGRPYEDLGTNGISCRRFWYSLTTSQSFSTMFRSKETKGTAHDGFGAKNGCYTGTGGVYHCGWYST